MNKIIFLIGLSISLILISGCVQQEKPKTELPNIKVIYSIGSGWTGWHETLTINNDGSILFEEQQPFDGNKTTKSLQLSNEENQEFKKLVNDANVFNFKDRYDCEPNCPTDLPSSSVKFMVNSKEKTVSMYAPQDMPENFKQILEKIRTIEQKFR